MAPPNTDTRWTLITFFTRPTHLDLNRFAHEVSGFHLDVPFTRDEALALAVNSIKKDWEGEADVTPYELPYDPRTDMLFDVDFNFVKSAPDNTIFFCISDSSRYTFDIAEERRKQMPPPPEPPKRPDALRSFEELPKIISNNIMKLPSGCWLWTGAITESGYGRLIYEGKSWAAHRFIYQFAAEELDDQFLLRHECDNRMCVAPHHLIPGNHLTNAEDTLSRDRINVQKFGKAMFLADHLGIPEVRQIRLEYFANGRTIRSLAREFKVGDNMIKSIVNYKIQFR